MNLSLLDPFVLAQDLPDALEGSLRSGHSTAVRFSHRGDLLASGRLDGVVVVFDFETNAVARKLRGHIRQIQSLSWSSSDQYLLSTSLDCKAILWDLNSGDSLRIVRFTGPIFFAELHPQNHLEFAVALFEAQPQIVNVSDPYKPKRTILSSAPRRDLNNSAAITNGKPDDPSKHNTIIVRYSPSGTRLFAGTNKGFLNVISTSTGQIITSCKLSSTLIVYLQLTPSGRDLVCNSSDRVIRTFTLPDFDSPTFDADTFHLEPEHKFQDLIDKGTWNYVCWSNSSEFVIAAARQTHRLSIWERNQGSLSKILELPEEITVVEWHPHKPALAAVGLEEGRIYIFNILTPQRWSALAPDFAEVEENVEYVEREDEFDILPQEELQKRRLDLEDEEVDVINMERVKPGQYVPGEDFLMPVLLEGEEEGMSESEEEVVNVGAGQWRRKEKEKDWMRGDEKGSGRGDDVTPSGDERRTSTMNGKPKRKRDG
jgi:COMPASS component SWD1